MRGLNLSGGGKQSTKELVVKILSSTWPLTAKQIFNQLKREGFNGTYQSVHKMMKLLEEQGVVVKKERAYQLNIDWIQAIKKEADFLEKKYAENISELESKDYKTHSFDTLIKLYRYIIFDFYEAHYSPGNDFSLCLFFHTPGLPGASDKELNQLKKILGRERHYCLVKGKTALDEYFANVLRELGKKTLTGKDAVSAHEIYTEGDYIAQVYYTPGFFEQWNHLYEKVKRLEDFDIQEYMNFVINKKTKIDVIVIKNPEIVKKLRQQTLSYFKEAGK